MAREVLRVLEPGGFLTVATHLGQGEAVITEFLGHEIEATGGTYYSRDELLGHIEAAGLVVVTERERDALPHEAPTRRIYVTARRTTIERVGES